MQFHILSRVHEHSTSFPLSVAWMQDLHVLQQIVKKNLASDISEKPITKHRVNGNKIDDVINVIVYVKSGE